MVPEKGPLNGCGCVCVCACACACACACVCVMTIDDLVIYPPLNILADRIKISLVVTVISLIIKCIVRSLE